MKKYTPKQEANIRRALNQLKNSNLIEDFAMESNWAVACFDHCEVRIISPIKDALQFTLTNGGDEPIKTFMTECAVDVLPIQRAILSLFGLVMLQAFESDWDGYTFLEGIM